jgi:hypothetical protein
VRFSKENTNRKQTKKQKTRNAPAHDPAGEELAEDEDAQAGHEAQEAVG